MTDIYSHEVVRAFASAWASIDGKSEEFEREADGSLPYDHPQYTGHYEGYMTEANELLQRAGKRITSFDLWLALD